MKNDIDTARKFFHDYIKLPTTPISEYAAMVAYADYIISERAKEVSDLKIKNYVMEKYYETSSVPFCLGVIEEIKWARSKFVGNE